MERIYYTEIVEGTVFLSFKDYAIEVESLDMLDQIEHSLGSYFRRIGNTVGILNFKNFVGMSFIGSKQVYVKSTKLSEDHYNQMINEIIVKMADLPFDFNSPTNEAFNIDEELSTSVLYHMYLIIRSLVFNEDPNLQSSLEAIVRNPTRKNIYEVKEKDVWEIDKVSNQVVTSLITKPQTLVEIPPNSSIHHSSFVKQFNKTNGTILFPSSVDSMVLNNSLDTVENRFVKHFLLLAEDIIEKFREVLENKERLINRLELVNTCKLISAILEEWLENDMFHEVGELDRIPFQSIALHKREGYKNMFKFFNLLHSSLYNPFDHKQLERIIENKDIATLYEIWTYFKMLNVIEEGMQIKPHEAVTIHNNELKSFIRNGIKVSYRFGGKVMKVWYNKTYRKGAGSYSLSLRPDIVIEMDTENFIFDAKFKLEKVRWDQNNEHELEEQHSYIFKNGDIYKMHTYKDAIDQAKMACILYPNPDTNSIAFFEDGGRHTFGVGAISLIPTAESGRQLFSFLQERVIEANSTDVVLPLNE